MRDRISTSAIELQESSTKYSFAQSYTLKTSNWKSFYRPQTLGLCQKWKIYSESGLILQSIDS